MKQQPEEWLDQQSEAALRATVPSSLSAASIALYARWWQFETWLRELIYVEFRAAYGAKWATHVASGYRQNLDASSLKHMTSADVDNPLAYLDSRKLFDLIAGEWFRFEHSLIDIEAWNGRRDELQKIRHRVMHLRQPHADDLARIEQTLRDLERGAFIALASYNRRRTPKKSEHTDPVSDGWLHRKHFRAHLIQHADAQYGATVLIETSKRPWLPTWPTDLSQEPGVFWHLTVMFRDRTIDPAQLWRELEDPRFRDLLVHLLVVDPYHAEFTFSAVDGQLVPDAIGYALEAMLVCSRFVRDIGEVDFDGVRRRATGIDYRVLPDSGWSLVSDDTVPICIFGAGGGVSSVPS
ncbi:Swt1 family HEPN domain-containing protein [Mycolicibacterium aichiense]|uniref:Swt1 family HEPN domain-containing protein n=1 Tax=Mycolicibacterium aichiense TaxID=1799 RepID=UPI003D669EBA